MRSKTWRNDQTKTPKNVKFLIAVFLARSFLNYINYKKNNKGLMQRG